MFDPLLELSQRDCSNDGSQSKFLWRIWLIIPKLSLSYPFLSGALVCINNGKSMSKFFLTVCEYGILATSLVCVFKKFKVWA